MDAVAMLALFPAADRPPAPRTMQTLTGKAVTLEVEALDIVDTFKVNIQDIGFTKRISSVVCLRVSSLKTGVCSWRI